MRAISATANYCHPNKPLGLAVMFIAHRTDFGFLHLVLCRFCARSCPVAKTTAVLTVLEAYALSHQSLRPWHYQSNSCVSSLWTSDHRRFQNELCMINSIGHNFTLGTITPSNGLGTGVGTGYNTIFRGLHGSISAFFMDRK